MEILKLRPSGKDYFWGGTRLKEEYGKKFDIDPVAESWECSVHPDGPSYITNGRYEGCTLAELLKKHPEYLGTKIENGELPVLVKFIDAKEKLSVQVHPDDAYAWENEKQNGKTEMWYIIDADEGASIIYVVKDNQVIALIGVKDIIRSESPYVIDILKKMGKEVIMLTGDNESTASVIASSLKIDKVTANVMPKDKSSVIKKLLNENKKVMMVGDGINDAPSLALATIGVSLKSGTDIASNEASVILMNNNLESILNLYTISEKTIKNIKQNLFWAFFYNMCMLPVAMGLFTKFGLSTNPMMASIAMTLSSLTVILNALRLKKIKLKRDE